MKVGDLVEKVKGYNPRDRKFTGIVIGFAVERAATSRPLKAINSSGFVKKVKVWSSDGEIENWLYDFCEVISEGR